MKKMKIGFTGYLKLDAPDFWQNVEELGKLGFQGMEHAAGLIEQEGGFDNIKRLRDLGLQPLTSATDLDKLRANGIGDAVEMAHKLDVDNISIYSCSIIKGMDGKGVVTYDQYMKDIEDISKFATAIKNEGLTMRYHNHAAEFRMYYDGMTAFEKLVRNAPDLQILLDVGWVAMGSYDPVRCLREWAPRMAALHLKDMQYAPLRSEWGQEYHNHFTSLGTGVVDIRGCMQAAIDYDITWGIMEQDSLNNLSAMDTLRTSYCNLKEYGLAE